jgi:hypothetical protein
MPRIFPWAVCAALSVLCSTGQQARVGVVMDFESAPGSASVAAMEQEVNDLLKPSGISLDWQLAKENRGDRPFASLVVLRFKGSCKADRVSESGAGEFGSLGESRALASTKVSDGHVLPFSEVRCDEVRGALRFLRPGVGLKERQLALGRALGRVVAHELYHIFAKTTAHGTHGLARPSQSLEELIAVEGPKFWEQDSRAMTAPAAAPEDKSR